MILAVIIIGILLIDVGLKGTEHQLASQLEQDFTGTNGFIAWFGAIVIIGSMGFIPGLEKPTRYLLGLVLVAIVLANQDFANNLVSGIQEAASQGPIPGQPITSSSSSSTGTLNTFTQGLQNLTPEGQMFNFFEGIF